MAHLSASSFRRLSFVLCLFVSSVSRLEGVLCVTMMQVEQPAEQQFAEGAMADEGMEVSSLKISRLPLMGRSVLAEGLVGVTHVQCIILQEVPQFQAIEVLQEHGIAANDIEKLQSAGYYTVESVRTNTHATKYRCQMPQTNIEIGPHLLFFLEFFKTDCPCNSPKAVRCERDFGSQGDETQGGKTNRA